MAKIYTDIFFCFTGNLKLMGLDKNQCQTLMCLEMDMLKILYKRNSKISRRKTENEPTSVRKQTLRSKN